MSARSSAAWSGQTSTAWSARAPTTATRCVEEIVGEIEGLQARLEELVTESRLPAEPDAVAIDRFLVEAYAEAWGY